MKRSAFPGLVGFVVCLAVSTAQAAPRGEALLKQAQQEISDGEFERARATLIQARGVTSRRALLGQIEYHLSLVWHTMDEQQNARRAIRRALTHTPGLRPDTDRIKPSFVALFDRVHRSLKGTVVVTCNLTNARVFVDGRAVGRVPYRGRLVIGRHEIEVRAADGQSRAEQVTVARDQQSKVRVTLRAHVPEPHRDPKVVQQLQPSPPEKGRLMWTWIAAAGTAVATGFAAGFGFAALSSHSDGEDLRTQRSADADTYHDVVDSLDRNRVAANISLGIAGALAVTTVALFFWERSREQPRAALHTAIDNGGLPRFDLTLSF